MGQPITLVVPAGVGPEATVDLEPLGQVPTAASKPYRFDGSAVAIPTTGLTPGFYGAWLRHGSKPPELAPMMVTILAPTPVTPFHPGVEIVGAAESGGDPDDMSVRQGSNPTLRYCLPAGADLTLGWVGVFPAGTPVKQLTKGDANTIGFWLKTPGGGPGGTECGESEAYASELSPGTNYEVMLFLNKADGTKQTIGSMTQFSVSPVLPH